MQNSRLRRQSAWLATQHMTSIDDRPQEVDKHLVPGHWNGDSIIRARKRSKIRKLVESTNLQTFFRGTQNASTLGADSAFLPVFDTVDAKMRLLFTYKQSGDKANHQHLTHITGVQVYYVHPNRTWE